MASAPASMHPDICRLRGEFRSQEMETGFWRDTRQEWLRQLQLICGFSGLFYLAGFGVDWLTVHDPATMAWLALVRVLVVAGTMYMIWQTPRMKEPGGVHLITLAGLMMYVIGTLVIVAMSPPDIMQHTISVVVIVLFIILLVPVPLAYVAISSAVLSGGFLVVLVVGMDPTDNHVALVVLDLIMTNVLSLIARNRLSRARRMQWTNLRSESQANEKMRREVAYRVQAEKEARESEERYRRLVELSPDAVVVHRRGCMLYANPGARLIMGIEEGSDVNGLRLIDFVHPDQREELERRLDDVKLGRNRNMPVWETRLVRGTGEIFQGEVVSGLTHFAGKRAIQSIVRDVTQRRRMEEELQRLAHSDPLTDACNRRRFEELAMLEMDRARRYQRPLSMLMLDLDHFKRINDRYGHAAGDEVLQRVVGVCQGCLRGQDILGRMGGEEFGVALPETGLAAALMAGERLRKAVEELRVIWEGNEIALTISTGVAELAKQDQRVDQCLRRADDALYTAKQNGRNQVQAG